MIDQKGRKPEYAPYYADGKTPEEAFGRLCRIVTILRGLCPWDRVQTHESLRKCMIEEAYEAVDAVDRQDYENLREELGDVLLQAVFNAELASEEGRFDITAVVNDECDKMIRRHPHIFALEEAKSVDKALEKWENVKGKEHGTQTASQRLRGVPKALPALTRSEKIQKRAAEVGFDWPDISGALQKVSEELEEFKVAYQESDRIGMEEELGDLIFSAVNVARFAKLDPEEALKAATDKFTDRFCRLEDSARAEGRELAGMTLEEMDALWDKIKG